jgi:CRP-like cAMP-binding protein
MEVKHEVEYEDGELILMEGGESDRNIYDVLLEGQARVTKETDKGQVTLALLEEGDIFGEVSFLAQIYGARSATIAARGKVKVGVARSRLGYLTKRNCQLSMGHSHLSSKRF